MDRAIARSFFSSWTARSRGPESIRLFSEGCDVSENRAKCLWHSVWTYRFAAWRTLLAFSAVCLVVHTTQEFSNVLTWRSSERIARTSRPPWVKVLCVTWCWLERSYARFQVLWSPVAVGDRAFARCRRCTVDVPMQYVGVHISTRHVMWCLDCGRYVSVFVYAVVCCMSLVYHYTTCMVWSMAGVLKPPPCMSPSQDRCHERS